MIRRGGNQVILYLPEARFPEIDTQNKRKKAELQHQWNVVVSSEL